MKLAIPNCVKVNKVNCSEEYIINKCPISIIGKIF